MTRIAKIVLILVALFAFAAISSAQDAWTPTVNDATVTDDWSMPASRFALPTNAGDLTDAADKLAILTDWAKFHNISTFGVTGADLEIYLVRGTTPDNGPGRADLEITGSATSFLSYHPSCAPDTRTGTSFAAASMAGEKIVMRGRIISTNTPIVLIADVTRYLCGQ